MSVASALLLAATVSWIDGILSVVLLGLLLPAALALTAGMIVLGRQRRDWRLLPGAAGTVVLFAAVVTPVRRDGGVDVRSSRYVAQVKHRADLVPVSAIRELIGAAGHEGRRLLFFTIGAYSRDSVAEAARAGMALFVVRHREGRLVAANPVATALLADGLTRSATPAAAVAGAPAVVPA